MNSVVAKVTPVTHFIVSDEPCFMFVEAWLTPAALTKGGQKYTPETWNGRHRWRIVWVNRGDALAEYHQLSPHQNVPGLRIPSFWEHTYGELCGMADEYAVNPNGADWDLAFLREQQEASTLVRDIIDQEEDRVYMVKNHSTFGRHFKKQRDGFPQALRRRIEEQG